MRLFSLIAAFGATATLAACAPPPSTTVVVTPPAQTVCIADQFQQYVGQKSPAISVPAGTVVRDYRSGSPITMDHNASRVNFEYDRSGTLVKVSCG